MPLVKRLHLLRRAHLVEREFDVRVELAVLADDAREKTSRAPQEEPDAERADLAEKRPVRDFDGAIGSEQRFARLGEEQLTVRRQAGAASGAIQQRPADLALKIGDLLADGGLRDMELAAGFAETAVVGDRAEVAQMSQFHILCSRISLSVFPMAVPGNNCETFILLEMSYSIKKHAQAGRGLVSMWIVKVALNRPYTFIVLAILILIAAPVVILRTPTDIFPNINIPVISIAWQYTD